MAKRSDQEAAADAVKAATTALNNAIRQAAVAGVETEVDFMQQNTINGVPTVVVGVVLRARL